MFPGRKPVLVITRKWSRNPLRSLPKLWFQRSPTVSERSSMFLSPLRLAQGCWEQHGLHQINVWTGEAPGCSENNEIKPDRQSHWATSKTVQLLLDDVPSEIEDYGVFLSAGLTVFLHKCKWKHQRTRQSKTWAVKCWCWYKGVFLKGHTWYNPEISNTIKLNLTAAVPNSDKLWPCESCFLWQLNKAPNKLGWPLAPHHLTKLTKSIWPLLTGSDFVPSHPWTIKVH